MTKKSFKASLTAAPAKRESDKDILELLEEKREEPAAPVSNGEPIEKFERRAEQPRLIQQDENHIPDVLSVPNITIEHQEYLDVKQSFYLREDLLENLKDYVHTRRIHGDYDYTQKQAVHEALELLFKDAKIEARPERLRQKEESRKDKIRKGKQNRP